MMHKRRCLTLSMTPGGDTTPHGDMAAVKLTFFFSYSYPFTYGTKERLALDPPPLSSFFLGDCDQDHVIETGRAVYKCAGHS